MTKWKLKCTECGREWILAVSYDLASMGKIYHYCPYCKKNTFHTVLERIEDESSKEVGAEDAVEGEDSSNLVEEVGEG